MKTLLFLILWFPPSGAATSLTVEFETPAACNDARDTLLSRLAKNAVYIIECLPKGEIRT
jgi:hypothetical protein